jgi:hypothetical protein
MTVLHVILVYCHKRESREYRMRVEGVASRHPDNAPGQDLDLDFDLDQER